ncbi:hypothetical protein GGR57DRAFT_506317 [Xylariaceae sp. FL1272]|nr:hypothetical protein GGR57DRAFT_506317 [Xylariaceae sp. FL1272]
MSHNMNPNEQNNLFSRNGITTETDWDTTEDTFTATRPPQYKTQKYLPLTGPATVPRFVVTDGLQFYLNKQNGCRPYSDATSHTDSTPTITADEAVAAAATVLPRRHYPAENLARGPRNHVLWHATRNYDGTLQPLTELAIAALNHSFRDTYTGNVDQWVDDQCPLALEHMSIGLSLLEARSGVTTRTESTAGSSSWTVVSSTLGVAPSHMDDDLRNAGAEFDDVPACINSDLMDEDCA